MHPFRLWRYAALPFAISLIAIGAFAFPKHTHASSPFLIDTFSGALNAPLNTHTSDSGATWATTTSAYHDPSGCTNSLELDGSGEVYSPNGPTCLYESSVVPPTSEYIIRFDFKELNGYGATNIVYRYDKSTDSGYDLTLSSNGGGHADVIVNSGGAGTSDLTSGTLGSGLTFVSGQTYHFELDVLDSAKSLYQNGVLVWSSTNNTVTGAGGIALLSDTNADLTDGAFISNLSVSTPTTPISPPAVTLLGTGPHGAALTAAEPASGTPPFTYQWYVGSPGFTPSVGNAIPGATSLSLVQKGLTASTTYSFKLVATDSANTTATTTDIIATTTATYAPGTFVWGDIGDSTTGSTVAAMVPKLEALLGVPVVSVDRAVPGKSTADFLPTNSVTNYLPDADLLFQAEDVSVVSDMLGLNDAGGSVTPSTFGSNTAAIADDLVSHGFKVVLDYPTYRTDNTSFDTNYLLPYEPQLNSIVNGTTIFQGDTTAYAQFEANPGWLADGLHPNGTGYDELSTFRATAMVATTTISSVSAAPSSTSAVITWNTSAGADSLVNYGLTSSYASSSPESDLSPYVLTHSVHISGLTASSTYHYQVQSRNSVMNVSTSTDYSFTTSATADVIPPTVTLTVPASGSTVSGSGVTFTAISSDNVGVTGVHFQVDGTNIGTSGNTSPYSITWDSTTVGNGSHTISAIASDAAGNTATSSVSITVSNAAAASSGGGAGFSSGGGGFSIGTPTVPATPTTTPITTPCAVGDRFNTSTGALCPSSSAITPLIPTLPATEPPVPSFTKDLYLGKVDPQVKLLQEFLNGQGLLVAAYGNGSPGHETDYFGTFTRYALKLYQARHAIKPTSGYFGAITRSYIAAHAQP